MADREVMIMVALNGARRSQADHPWLPVTPGEVAAEARACLDEGAAALHVHVRGENGEHSLSANRYRKTIEAIRDKVGDDLVIQITSEAVGIYPPDRQMAMVKAVRPEAVSLAVRELVPDEAHEDEAGRFFSWLKNAGILAQLILYSPEDLARLDRLMKAGVVPFKRPFVLFGMGYHNRSGAPEDLEPFLDVLNASNIPAKWAVCAFGRREVECMGAAFSAGGHIRVGFENNIETPEGEPLTSNAQSVALARAAVEAQNGRLMTGPQAREFMRKTIE